MFAENNQPHNVENYYFTKFKIWIKKVKKKLKFIKKEKKK